jgi:cytochrome c oxidase cbb3-type subunit 2
MNRYLSIFAGALGTVAFAFLVLVLVPRLQLSGVTAPPALAPWADSTLVGRGAYVSLGCLYCHSQQVRPPGYGSDQVRGWGRASFPEDYAYDRPHQLGTMRTGPDLMNIGVRQPSRDWQLAHLYQPRAMTPGSVMPSFPFLFQVRDRAEMGDEIVNLPPGVGPAGKVVVATPKARALVSYLLSLRHEYPAGPAAVPASAGGSSP